MIKLNEFLGTMTWHTNTLFAIFHVISYGNDLSSFFIQQSTFNLTLLCMQSNIEDFNT